MAVDVTALTEAYPGFKTLWGMDEFLFAAQGDDLNHSLKADKVEGSGFGTQVKNNLPGPQEGMLKIKGLAAMGRGKVVYIINQRFGRMSPVNVWYVTQSLNPGMPIVMQPSSITDASITASMKDSVKFDSEFDARGAVDHGFILVSPNTLIATTPGTGTVDDNTVSGGATSVGGTGQLHLWAVDGGTSWTVAVVVQHSGDLGVTWTTLLTFVTMTAIGSQRVKLPSTTTVNAQVRAQWTLTGTPTDVQMLCGFARGIDFTL